MKDVFLNEDILFLFRFFLLLSYYDRPAIYTERILNTEVLNGVKNQNL